jgi:hypothetical protein
MEYMRIWKEIDINQVKEHIIMVDDQLGFCPNCKKIGIELKTLGDCPSCGRKFKFVSSKEAKNGRSDIVMRIKKKLPDLQFVDYDDYERITGKKKAESLFKI